MYELFSLLCFTYDFLMEKLIPKARALSLILWTFEVRRKRLSYVLRGAPGARAAGAKGSPRAPKREEERPGAPRERRETHAPWQEPSKPWGKLQDARCIIV